MPRFFFEQMRHFKEIFRGSKKISPERKAALLAFCKPLGLKFRDLELLDLAFHHRSFSNESRAFKRCNNERLEFLGDSVLGLATAAFLYEDMAQNPEGDLAKIKAAVVSEKALAPVALEYGIDKMLVMGKGEEMSGGRTKPAILADCMEAVIGAYYLDSGYEAAEEYILRFIVPAVRSVQENKAGRDYKSLLQEAFQKKMQGHSPLRACKDTRPRPRARLLRLRPPWRQSLRPGHRKEQKGSRARGRKARARANKIAASQGAANAASVRTR